jgi:hypothetical protein
MATTAEQLQDLTILDDEYASMIAFAASPEGQDKIAQAQAEIDEEFGILAGERHFQNLKQRHLDRLSRKILP